MNKKLALLFGLSAVYFAQAQDISTIRNTVDIYSNSNLDGSSRYQAMAGSMGALGGDASTLNTNPAGIGVNIANDFSATLSINSNKNSTSYSGATKNYTINKTDIGNVGGVITFRTAPSSVWKFVNIGVNYSSQTLDQYAETPGSSQFSYDIYDQDNNLVDNLSFAGHAYNRYGHQTKMSIGVGANYNNKIYLGAGINIHNATLDQYDTAAFKSNVSNRTDYYSKQYTPFSESSDGFSASVGIIGKVNQNLRLGASIETPTWWSISRVYSFYEDQIHGDGTASEDRRLSSPFKTTLSAAYVANKNFSINVDYSLGLSKAKYRVDGAAERELNNFFNANAKNQSEIKVGAEYRLSGFRLRGGYGYASSPFNNMNVNSFVNGANQPMAYDNFILGKRNTVAAGLGYDFGGFYVDAAYQNITSEYSNPFLQGSADYNSGYFGSQYIINSDAYIVSKVKNTRNNFFVTVGWKF